MKKEGGKKMLVYSFLFYIYEKKISDKKNKVEIVGNDVIIKNFQQLGFILKINFYLLKKNHRNQKKGNKVRRSSHENRRR
jgi:hypothetical protein